MDLLAELTQSQAECVQCLTAICDRHREQLRLEQAYSIVILFLMGIEHGHDADTYGQPRTLLLAAPSSLHMCEWLLEQGRRLRAEYPAMAGRDVRVGDIIANGLNEVGTVTRIEFQEPWEQVNGKIFFQHGTYLIHYATAEGKVGCYPCSDHPKDFAYIRPRA